MQARSRRPPFVIAIVIAGALAAAPAFAAKPEWAGKGKADKHERAEHAHDRHDRYDSRFSDDQRTAMHTLYADQLRGGHCPPGLAKKRNGCLPPGQAKKWAVGRPLDGGIVFYPLPVLLRDRLGPPPAGHRYVRVANDILMIAIGTSLVVDAIEDLGAMR